jgi:hypothetical protein
VQRHVLAIPGFCRKRLFAAKIELAVDIIFNQRDVVLRQQRDQLRFFSALSVKPSGFWLLVISQQALTG